MVKSVLGRLGLVSGLALVAATPALAEKAEPKPVMGEVRIILPNEIETLPPIPLPEVNAQLARPEAERRPAYQDRRYRRLATPEFEPFDGEVDFRRYMRATERLRRNERRRRYGAAPDGEIVVAMVQDAEPECAVPEDCPAEEAGDYITVTGSRIASSPQAMAMPVTAVTGSDNPNITNTQVASVDEGDIVKLIGEYLLVLQDGRIFAVHYPTMTLTDRQDVYRKDEDGDAIGADWYDEMLVQGDQIIVTAYSYEDDASEITVLRLDQETGQVSPRGVFLISSDDYYSIDNYATRIVGDKLVIHTPYEASDLVSRQDRPVIRRWTNAEDFYDSEEEGAQILNARDIYQPVFGTREPWIHSISICPLSNVIERGLQCDTTGFLGSEIAEMYVAGDAIYLWNSAIGWDEQDWSDCEVGTPPPEFGEVPPAAIYRVPIRGGEVEVMGVRGLPIDQFSIDAKGNRFRALSGFFRHACSDDDIPKEFALLNAPQSRFRNEYFPARPSHFERLPSLMQSSAENRFVGDWVIYGGRSRYSRRPPRDREGEKLALSNVVHAVPIDDPEQAQTISVGHTLVRLERMGQDGFIANGYADREGLRVSYVGLDDENLTAAIRSSALLEGRYESESRSHAFNATYTYQGDGTMGVPTVGAVFRSNGYPWYSDVSDLSFLNFSNEGMLSDAGVMLATPESQVQTGAGYSCEISCIDWYGNARPIFLGGKVYGLMATELVEAEMVDGQVTERRRVDLTAPLKAKPPRE